VDVTGGMQSKVGQMLEVVKASPMLKVLIFSGEDPEKLQKALNGEKIGTMISVT
jgi:isopentenyl phosphate kinase